MVSLLPWIAHPLFLGLVCVGAYAEELGRVGVIMYAALWLAGYFGLRLLPGGAAGFLLFSSYVAILDIVLVFVVFKGDVRLR